MLSMFKAYIQNIPQLKFWFANLVFWLTLNTIAASHSYRMSLHFNRPAVWADVWLEYLPWWGNWALIAPLIIAAAAVIKLDTKKLIRFTLLNGFFMVVIFSFYLGMTVFEIALLEPGDFTLEVLEKCLNRLWLSPIHLDFLVYMAVLGSGYAFSYYKHAKVQTLHSEQLAKQLVEVELHSLKSQLNPHFLFNTLNTISGLIRFDDKQNAVKALNELSLMLRKVLENHNNQLITLKQEIEFINSYLTIQKMRFSNKLDTEVNVNDGCLDIEIPFMLLQPLVENAVQHGSQLESNKNTVKLDISVKLQRLDICLVNKIPEKNENKGFGIGLKTCRERMEKLYPNNFSLTLTKLENGYFQTYLSLPIEAHDD